MKNRWKAQKRGKKKERKKKKRENFQEAWTRFAESDLDVLEIVAFQEENKVLPSFSGTKKKKKTKNTDLKEESQP